MDIEPTIEDSDYEEEDSDYEEEDSDYEEEDSDYEEEDSDYEEDFDDYERKKKRKLEKKQIEESNKFANKYSEKMFNEEEEEDEEELKEEDKFKCFNKSYIMGKEINLMDDKSITSNVTIFVRKEGNKYFIECFPYDSLLDWVNTAETMFIWHPETLEKIKKPIIKLPNSGMWIEAPYQMLSRYSAYYIYDTKRTLIGSTYEPISNKLHGVYENVSKIRPISKLNFLKTGVVKQQDKIILSHHLDFAPGNYPRFPVKIKREKFKDEEFGDDEYEDDEYDENYGFECFVEKELNDDENKLSYRYFLNGDMDINLGNEPTFVRIKLFHIPNGVDKYNKRKFIVIKRSYGEDYIPKNDFEISLDSSSLLCRNRHSRLALSYIKNGEQIFTQHFINAVFENIPDITIEDENPPGSGRGGRSYEEYLEIGIPKEILEYFGYTRGLPRLQQIPDLEEENEDDIDMIN